MSNPNPKPVFAPSNRIKWLAITVILVIAVYTAGWFYVAQQIAQVASLQIGALEERGISVDCPDQEVRGYPFRIGVFCSDFSLDIPAEGLRVDGGALRSAAQVYEPRRAVVEIDGPLAITFGEIDGLLSYVVGQAVVEARSAGQRALSAEFTDGEGEVGEFSADWDRLTFFSRESDGNLELAFQAVGLTTSLLPTLPVVTDADIVLEDASYQTDTLRGKKGTLRRFTLGLTDDRGLLAEGPFSVTNDGLVNAEIAIRVVDVPGLVTDLETVSPQLASAVGGLLNLGSTTGNDGDEVELNVSIVDGRARYGIIPLGAIPPL